MTDALHDPVPDPPVVPPSERPTPDADQVAARWRLLLGTDVEGATTRLTKDQQAMDAALGALYNRGPGDGPGGEGYGAGKGLGDLSASAPTVARWLGDIRTYFPNSVVKVMQADAIDRLGLRQLLLEPEMLQAVQPDVHLASMLASMSGVIPEESKRTARQVVAQVVAEVEKRLAHRMQAAVTGALNRATRTRRPRHTDIDWPRTIQANLKNYLPEHHTVVPERLVGHGRRQQGVQREVVLCVDQSGSMASSVVYASIFASVMASLRALRTSLVVYDTSVVDLTDRLADPVDVIFGTQLGGGTDTSPALDHCATLITRPRDTVLLLISDLFDSDPPEMVRRLTKLQRDGVTVVVLLALSDDGAPGFHHVVAQEVAALGMPAFACTPDEFPDLIAAAIRGDDLVGFAERTEAARARR